MHRSDASARATPVVVVARVLVAALIAAAVAAQLHSSLRYADQHAPGHAGAVVANFWSYFTIDSNTLAAVLLVVSAGVRLRRGRADDPTALTVARVAVTTYMVITGVVYNAVLRGLAADGAVVGWANEVVHVVAPVCLLLDWVLAPGRTPRPPRDVAPVLAFPLVWAAWTLVRGPFATDPFEGTGYWYPYPFINPETAAHGYLSVAVAVVLVALAFALVASGLLWVSRRWPGPGREDPAAAGAHAPRPSAGR